jgi:hypothetical protein
MLRISSNFAKMAKKENSIPNLQQAISISAAEIKCNRKAFAAGTHVRTHVRNAQEDPSYLILPVAHGVTLKNGRCKDGSKKHDNKDRAMIVPPLNPLILICPHTVLNSPWVTAFSPMRHYI